MNHRIGSIAFGIVVGLAVAFWSLQWVSDPGNRELREREEAAVVATRAGVTTMLDLGSPEFVDPLKTRRAVGKTYVYAADNGWEVSGYYRRDDGDKWHPFLVRLSPMLEIDHLKVGDTGDAVVARAANDARIEIVR